jgi:hypothetical protein
LRRRASRDQRRRDHDCKQRNIPQLPQPSHFVGNVRHPYPPKFDGLGILQQLDCDCTQTLMAIVRFPRLAKNRVPVGRNDVDHEILAFAAPSSKLVPAAPPSRGEITLSVRVLCFNP